MAHLTRRKRINRRRRKVDLLHKMYEKALIRVRKRTFDIPFKNPLDTMPKEKLASLAAILQTHTIHFGPEGWSVSRNLDLTDRNKEPG